VIRARLEAEGIPALVRPGPSPLSLGLEPSAVYVGTEHEAAAREVLLADAVEQAFREQLAPGEPEAARQSWSLDRTLLGWLLVAAVLLVVLVLAL
jgi:hypothetical protein